MDSHCFVRFVPVVHGFPNKTNHLSRVEKPGQTFGKRQMVCSFSRFAGKFIGNISQQKLGKDKRTVQSRLFIKDLLGKFPNNGFEETKTHENDTCYGM